MRGFIFYICAGNKKEEEEAREYFLLWKVWKTCSFSFEVSALPVKGLECLLDQCPPAVKTREENQITV